MSQDAEDQLIENIQNPHGIAFKYSPVVFILCENHKTTDLHEEHLSVIQLRGQRTSQVISVCSVVSNKSRSVSPGTRADGAAALRQDKF
jgi:hypothetical protein